ncbi:MAG: VWA domain-containing protein [Gloeotrichia echinulata GP01]
MSRDDKSSIVLVIDTSASMKEYSLVDLTIRDSKALVDKLEEGDQLAVVTFDSEGRINYPPNSNSLVKLTNPKDHPETKAAKEIVNALKFDGRSTNIGGGLQKAISLLKGITKSHGVVLLTDGQNNVGSSEDIFKILDPEIPVFACGLGRDFDYQLLKQIAEKTGGEFYPETQPVTMMQIYHKIHAKISGKSLLINNLNTVAEVSSESQPNYQVTTVDIPKGTPKAMFSVVWLTNGLKHTDSHNPKRDEVSVKVFDPKWKELKPKVIDNNHAIYTSDQEIIEGKWNIQVINGHSQELKFTVGVFGYPMPVPPASAVRVFGNIHDTIRNSDIVAAGEPDPATQIWDQYMANIIKQLPNSQELSVLTGIGNAQASFYFKSPTTGEINADLYNDIISRRVQGCGSQFGVNQARLLSSAFINAYIQLYLSLRYQLSQADKAQMQLNVAETAKAVSTLTPIWNNWVDLHKGSGVPKLDTTNTSVALIQLTEVMQVSWVNPKYKEKLQENPDYPYNHTNDFNLIFSNIPLSVPKQMRDLIRQIYINQGTGGGITAKEANANQVLTGVRDNIQNPSTENGGLKLTGSSKMIPGLKIQPADPTSLVYQLKQNPPSPKVSYEASVTKSNSTTLTFEASGSGSISIPILNFLSLSVKGEAKTNIFQQDYAGSNFSVEVVVNNPTIQPIMTVEPLLYNISTNQGWLYVDPIHQALDIGTKTDVTGFAFDGGVPDFDFSKGGNFGYISALVLSQFLELNLTFKQCSSKDVKKYFDEHTSATISFLGIPLGGVNQSSSYSYNYSEQTETTITVTMKPNPPGYIPGGNDITESLCNLVAVGVTYPLTLLES